MNTFFRHQCDNGTKRTYWLCKHENVRSSQPCISMNFCTEFNTARKFFHVGIVKFTLWKTLFREWFLTNSYIQVKNMATSLWEPRSDLSLKDAASSTGGITWGIVNYLRKRKKLILAWSITYEMNENTFIDSFFFRFDLFVSLFSLLSAFLWGIVKSLIATST